MKGYAFPCYSPLLNKLIKEESEVRFWCKKVKIGAIYQGIFYNEYNTLGSVKNFILNAEMVFLKGIIADQFLVLKMSKKCVGETEIMSYEL